MVEIEIDETQREALEELRTELADEHVGEYGHVRDRDVIQYLLDHYDAADTTVADSETTSESDDAVDDESGDTDPDDADADDGDSASRLERMMGLLDDHDDVWKQADSEEGRYVVTLPDGSTEHVRTKDDVRALLFQHYD